MIEIDECRYCSDGDAIGSVECCFVEVPPVKFAGGLPMDIDHVKFSCFI